MNKTAIKQYQQATRDRAAVKTEGGTIIRVEVGAGLSVAGHVGFGVTAGGCG